MVWSPRGRVDVHSSILHPCLCTLSYTDPVSEQTCGFPRLSSVSTGWGLSSVGLGIRLGKDGPEVGGTRCPDLVTGTFGGVNRDPDQDEGV